MICITPEDSVKVWLNPDLALNSPPPSHRISRPAFAERLVTLV